MTVEEARLLRRAWSALRRSCASDDEILLLIKQPAAVLDALKRDYDNDTNPYVDFPPGKQETMNEKLIDRRLRRIEMLLVWVLRTIGGSMSELDNRISDLKSEVAAGTTVEKSTLALVQSIPQLISDAVSKAQAAGATPEQLQALTDLRDSLAANDKELADAVAANTPAAGVTSGDSTPPTTG